MAFEYAKAMLGEAVLKQGLRYLADNPETNLIKLLKWGETIAREEVHKQYIQRWLELFEDENNNWRRFIVRVLKQAHPNVINKLGVNFFINAGVLAPAARERAEKKHGVHIPWAMLIDPTGRCNLACKGCWAAEYDRTLDMDYSTLDRVITEAEELGIRFIVVSGGEPLVRMHELLNGTLIDSEAARQFAEAGNVTFAISLEGFEEQTDARRGNGVFAKVMRAMDNLKEAGVVFGFSATYTRNNTEVVGSERFIDLMVEKGCAFGWLFTYVPVGGQADIAYMATPEQRKWMYEQVRKWRQEKPIFVADFWNDGAAVGGCIAGGRSYFHINAMGDVEPCAFIHYANVNIKNTSLVDALKCALFRAYQARQPFNLNHMRPCPLIDNPKALEEIVAESGAYPTQRNRISASQLCQPLYGYAEAWGKIADRIWQEQAPAAT
ncbi:MAG: radical SAM protein [Bacillota bacterium]